jgi:TetR/AcrR family transcriptional regulator, transcriptional repressor of bet genes
VPKLGMGPIRREQICRAAAAVISREGFAGTTMRMVAEEAGVSTGMLNHYFVNRQDLLTQALIFVSERAQERMRRAIAEVPAGRERLVALLDSALAEEEEVTETWRVWINSYGEAVRLPELRHTIDTRLSSWYELIDSALEGLVPPDDPNSIPWSWRFDAVLNGLTLQALTSDAALGGEQIRDEVIRTLFPDGDGAGDGADGRRAGGATVRGKRASVGG